MNMRRYVLPTLATLALFISVAVGMAVQAPTTWIVDASGGPGTNFTQLQPAINAASPGDLILVRPGSYGNFDLSKALTILGEQDVRVSTGLIHDVQNMTILAELEFQALTVRDCAGTVVLDRLLGRHAKYLKSPTLVAENSDDVRLIDLDQAGSSSGGYAREPAITVRASRMEITSSYLRGVHGKDIIKAGYAGDGAPAVIVEQAGYVHLSRCTVRGGSGGRSFDLLFSLGGEGASAVEITDGDALITGRGSDLLKGGRGGSILLYGYAGDGGDGIHVSSSGSVRYSNVAVQGGGAGGWTASWGQDVVVDPGGTVKQPKVADPVLERLGTPTAGGSFTLKLRSKPGNYSRLFWGFAPALNSSPGVLVDSLLMKEGTLPVGVIPPSGVLVIPITLDPALPQGTVLYYQAMSIFPSGKIRRTNSVPVVIR